MQSTNHYLGSVSLPHIVFMNELIPIKQSQQCLLIEALNKLLATIVIIIIVFMVIPVQIAYNSCPEGAVI